MNKILLAVIIVASLGAVVVIFQRGATESKAARRGMHMSHPVKCFACGAKSEMTFEAMKDFIKSGQSTEVPGQFRQFPCASCGKTAVGLDNEGKYEPEKK